MPDTDPCVVGDSGTGFAAGSGATSSQPSSVCFAASVQGASVSLPSPLPRASRPAGFSIKRPAFQHREHQCAVSGSCRRRSSPHRARWQPTPRDSRRSSPGASRPLSLGPNPPQRLWVGLRQFVSSGRRLIQDRPVATATMTRPRRQGARTCQMSRRSFRSTLRAAPRAEVVDHIRAQTCFRNDRPTCQRRRSTWLPFWHCRLCSASCSTRGRIGRGRARGKADSGQPGHLQCRLADGWRVGARDDAAGSAR